MNALIIHRHGGSSLDHPRPSRHDEVRSGVLEYWHKLSPGTGGDGEGACSNRLRCGSRSMAAFAMSEAGQGRIEYALTMALPALCVVGWMQSLTSTAGSEFNSSGSSI